MSIENLKINSSERGSEEVIKDIINKFRAGEWKQVLSNESIGGNAGVNRAAINSFVEKDTGRIIIFGNIQDIPENITENPNYIEAAFVYKFGNVFQRLRNPELDLEPDFFEKVFASGASEEAVANLNKALAEFNKEYISEQRRY